jgi:hypothetical protein
MVDVFAVSIVQRFSLQFYTLDAIYRTRITETALDYERYIKY